MTFEELLTKLGDTERLRGEITQLQSVLEETQLSEANIQKTRDDLVNAIDEFLQNTVDTFDLASTSEQKREAYLRAAGKVRKILDSNKSEEETDDVNRGRRRI